MGDLHEAAVAGDAARIRALAASGADLHTPDECGRTPFMAAVIAGKFGAVAALLELQGGTAAPRYHGESLTHWAVEGRDPKVLRLLLEHGADPNEGGERGWTALQEAAMFGFCGMVRALLEAGADPDGGQAARGDTPLLLACRYARPEAHGAWVRVVALLLDHGADLARTDSDGERPLDLAASGDDLRLARLLLAHGARHTLLTAARMGDLAAVNVLLAQGADVGVRNSYGSTPLHDAVARECRGVVGALLAAGADVEARDSFQETPLHVAAQVDAGQACVLALLDGGADPNSRNEAGQTPLHYAAMNGGEALAEALVQRGANSDLRDAGGLTPADEARTAGHANLAVRLERGVGG